MDASDETQQIHSSRDRHHHHLRSQHLSNWYAHQTCSAFQCLLTRTFRSGDGREGIRILFRAEILVRLGTRVCMVTNRRSFSHLGRVSPLLERFDSSTRTDPHAYSVPFLLSVSYGVFRLLQMLILSISHIQTRSFSGGVFTSFGKKPRLLHSA